MNSTVLAAVDTLSAPKQNELNPRATRYGMLPIWSMPVQSKAFYVWEIPANMVFPFRPFVGEVVRAANNEVLATDERMPASQVADMYVMSPYFLEFTALNALQDETKAQQVAEILYNPSTCTKYARELGNKCIHCWINYLNGEATERVAQLLGTGNEVSNAAMASIDLLREGFGKALAEASRRVDVAVRDIDDPKSGKTMFYDADYTNVYHTHNDRPQYKTTTAANSNIGQQIADAILAGQKAPAGIDEDKLAAILRKMEELETKVAAYEKVSEPDRPDGVAYTPDLKTDTAREAKKKFLIEKIENAETGDE